MPKDNNYMKRYRERRAANGGKLLGRPQKNSGGNAVTNYVNSFKGLDWDGALRNSLISSNRIETRELVSTLNRNGVNFMSLQQIANNSISDSYLNDIKMNINARLNGLSDTLRTATDDGSSYYRSLRRDYEYLNQFNDYLLRRK